MISQRAARRIALAAQGFADPRPGGSADRRHLRRVLGRTQLLQVDSVNVFERAHYLPLFSRLGTYDKALVDRAAYCRRPVDRELFEYWGHEASLLPVALHPLLRWRMARAHALGEGWGRTQRLAAEQPAFVETVLQLVRDEGPLTSGELQDRLGSARSGPSGPWWDWSPVKVALEHLFWTGQVTTADRRAFTRVYDVVERVLPPAVLALPTPPREDAQRELVRLAARSHGVATERDLRDYFRLRPAEAVGAVRDLVDSGELLPVAVEGWKGTGYLWHQAAVPRRVRASALLSPFDPLVWERARTSRLFGFDYRIEIYVPAAQRVHGYYVLPFLHDEALVARVDLKADRAGGVLRVLAAWAEPGHATVGTAEALRAELHRAASWQGLGEVVVEPRGDLAALL